MDIDVTDKVDFGLNDEDLLPLYTCVCGQTFNSWDFILICESNEAAKCNNCKRELYFKLSIRIYEKSKE